MNKTKVWDNIEFEKIMSYQYKQWIIRLEKNIAILADRIQYNDSLLVKRRMYRKLINMINIIYSNMFLKEVPEAADRIINKIFISELFIMVNENCSAFDYTDRINDLKKKNISLDIANHYLKYKIKKYEEMLGVNHE